MRRGRVEGPPQRPSHDHQPIKTRTQRRSPVHPPARRSQNGPSSRLAFEQLVGCLDDVAAGIPQNLLDLIARVSRAELRQLIDGVLAAQPGPPSLAGASLPLPGHPCGATAAMPVKSRALEGGDGAERAGQPERPGARRARREIGGARHRARLIPPVDADAVRRGRVAPRPRATRGGAGRWHRAPVAGARFRGPAAPPVAVGAGTAPLGNARAPRLVRSASPCVGDALPLLGVG